MKICTKACIYEQYDPQTLIPTNESTLIRLAELEWSTEDFAGKSILDIGCNAGLLSLFCHKLGASSITSIDVTDHFVEYFQEVVSRHNLNISVQRKSLFDIDVNSCKYDVVLFMEVLHWIVQQGKSIEEAIAKVSSLTNETLYIETPYDVNEPSIKAQANYTESEYSLEIILKELNKYFRNIQILKFMTYFGEMKSSKRILIKATNKRIFISALQDIHNFNFFNHKLPGNNYCNIIFTLKGIKIIKQSSPTSTFASVSSSLQNSIIDELKNAQGPLVLPDSIKGKYIFCCEKQNKFMIFPFCGNMHELCGYKAIQNLSIRRNEVFETVLSCCQQMQSLDQALILQLRNNINRRSHINIDDFSNSYLEHFSQNQLINLFTDINSIFKNGYDINKENCLIHDDLQLGNFVTDSNNTICIVDLDNIRTGPIYSDIISHCVYVGATHKELSTNIKNYSKLLQHAEPTLFDYHFSLMGIFKWMLLLNKRNIQCDSKLITQATQGIKSVQTALNLV